jgi:hypothetical protein
MRVFDPKLRADLLSEFTIDGRNRAFAVELDESVAARKILKLFFD